MSIHWAGGRFHDWALMSFRQTWWTVPGARICWVTWGKGVLCSRGPSLLWGFGLSWQPPSSSDHGVLLPDNPDQPECWIFLHVFVWPPSQKLGNPGDEFLLSSAACLWADILAAIGHHRCCKAVCYHSSGGIRPVRCSFSLSTVMFPTHFQSAGNATEF